MSQPRHGHGLLIWSIGCLVVFGFIVIWIGADAARCDATDSKFCDIGRFIAMVIGVGGLVIWLVGVVIGLALSAKAGPTGPRCPACKDPYQPGTLDCPTCGEPLDGVATPARRRTRHRFRAYRGRRRLTR